MKIDIRQVDEQVSNFRNVPFEATAEALTKYLVDQPQDKKKEAIQFISNAISAAGGPAPIPPPSSRIKDNLWIIVIAAFSIVLVGSFIALTVGVFIPAQGKVTPELILTMFMSVVGFLAGLFVPSPVANRDQGKNS